MIAEKLGDILIEEGRGTDAVKAGMNTLLERGASARTMPKILRCARPGSVLAVRTTRPPKCLKAAALMPGLVVTIMVQWMDRETTGFTHMGGEGANWIGEAPFSKTKHVFQNLGDGTYNHSGVQAIRAALAANTNITYKILFNDAVAMTGGQTNDGRPEPRRPHCR